MKAITMIIVAGFAALSSAAVGQKCSGDLQHPCICLEETICRKYIHGTPVKGKCPNDSKSVLGCYIYCT